MPHRGRAKSTNNKRNRSEDSGDYVSDDGFVEDGARETKSKTKKARVKVNPAKTDEDEERQMWEVCVPQISYPGNGASWDCKITALELGLMQLARVQISNKRRVTVGNFKGVMMIGIREYYYKDGEMLPGSKVCLHQPRAFLDAD